MHVIFKAVIERYGYHEDRDDDILQISERPRHAVLPDLGRRDPVQELLHKSHGAEPAADRPAERQSEDHDDPQHIPAGAVAGVGERILNGAQGAGTGSSGTGIAVKARDAYGIAVEAGDADRFRLSLIDFSVYKASEVRVIEERAVKLNKSSL